MRPTLLSRCALPTGLVVGTALLLLPIAAQAGFRVSSKKEVGKSTEFDAASAIDDDKSTAWQVDPESEQVGEWIEIDLPKGEVDKIAVMVGWEKSDDSWKDYGRLKAGRLELFNDDGEGGWKQVYEKTVNFEDKKGLQIVDVDDTKVGGDLTTAKARLTITEFTKGDDYPSVAIGEVRIMLKEQDAPALFVDGEPESAEGKDAGNMIDGNPRTSYVSPEGGVPPFVIEASGWGVSSLVITPGPKPYARPKTVEVKCAAQTRTFTLEDNGKPQSFMLPSIVGYTGSAWGEVQIAVKDTYEGTEPGVAIAEIALKATNYDGL